MNCVCTLRGMEKLGGGRRCVQRLYIMGYPFHIEIMLLFPCFNQGKRLGDGFLLHGIALFIMTTVCQVVFIY